MINMVMGKRSWLRYSVQAHCCTVITLVHSQTLHSCIPKHHQRVSHIVQCAATRAGMMMASFSEGLKLAAEVGVDQSTLLEAIGISAIAAPMYKLKARCLKPRGSCEEAIIGRAGWVAQRLSFRCRDCQSERWRIQCIARLVGPSTLATTRLLIRMLERCSCSSMQGPNMIKGEYPTAFPLKHQHKDLRLALELADTGTLAELPLAKLTEAIYRQGARSLAVPWFRCMKQLLIASCLRMFACSTLLACRCTPATKDCHVRRKLAPVDAVCWVTGVEEGFGDMDFSAVMEVKHPPAET